MKKNIRIIKALVIILLFVGGFCLGKAEQLIQTSFMQPEYSWAQTEKFETELESARGVAQSIHANEGMTYIYLSKQPYKGWEMVEVFESKFGYKENEQGLEIIVGNHEGSETATAVIPNATGAKVIQMGYEYNSEEKICIQKTSKYLIFECDGVKYAIDSNLDVWESVS